MSMKKTEPVHQPEFDDVLRRMLASPPAPHVKKKPAVQPADPTLLTPKELDALREHANMLSDFGKKTFAANKKPAK